MAMSAKKSYMPPLEIKDKAAPMMERKSVIGEDAPVDAVATALKAILAAKTIEECKAHAQEALAAHGGEEKAEGEEDESAIK